MKVGLQYFGDMLDSGGETDTDGFLSSWAEIHELDPFLISIVFYLKIKRQMCVAYVRSKMVYGSEMWWLRLSKKGTGVKVESNRCENLWCIIEWEMELGLY
jgi:hypothetical protein